MTPEQEEKRRIMKERGDRIKARVKRNWNYLTMLVIFLMAYIQVGLPAFLYVFVPVLMTLYRFRDHIRFYAKFQKTAEELKAMAKDEKPVQ